LFGSHRSQPASEVPPHRSPVFNCQILKKLLGQLSLIEIKFRKPKAFDLPKLEKGRKRDEDVEVLPCGGSSSSLSSRSDRVKDPRNWGRLKSNLALKPQIIKPDDC
jgi:hypothetical protein